MREIKNEHFVDVAGQRFSDGEVMSHLLQVVVIVQSHGDVVPDFGEVSYLLIEYFVKLMSSGHAIEVVFDVIPVVGQLTLLADLRKV